MFSYQNPEPVRYQKKLNNGWRKRMLAFGAYNAETINAARRGDFEFVLSRIQDISYITAKKTYARRLLILAKKLPADVPAYKITDTNVGYSTDKINYRHLTIPMLGNQDSIYEYKNPEIQWMHVHGAMLPKYAWQDAAA